MRSSGRAVGGYVTVASSALFVAILAYRAIVGPTPPNCLGTPTANKIFFALVGAVTGYLGWRASKEGRVRALTALAFFHFFFIWFLASTLAMIGPDTLCTPRVGLPFKLMVAASGGILVGAMILRAAVTREKKAASDEAAEMTEGGTG